MSNILDFKDYTRMAAAQPDPDDANDPDNGDVRDVVFVRPKTTAHSYAGHRFVLRYDPNAAVGSRWHWTVRYTKTYEFTGTAKNIGIAERMAKRKIDELSDFMGGAA